MPNKKSSPKPSASKKSSSTFTPEEKAAMREYAQERQQAARRGPRATKADGEADLLAAIAKMTEPDRTMAQRLHALIQSAAPSLSPKTWYGMPAYANADGNVVCFFQNGQKFKTRYCTLGFSDKANLDQGNLWPTSFALKALTPETEAQITQLLNKAVS